MTSKEPEVELSLCEYCRARTVEITQCIVCGGEGIVDYYADDPGMRNPSNLQSVCLCSACDGTGTNHYCHSCERVY